MATSSILTELVIEDPKKAEAFINALEMSSQDPRMQPVCPVHSHIRQCERDTEVPGKKKQVSLCIGKYLR